MRIAVDGGVDNVALVEGDVDGVDLPLGGGLGEVDVLELDIPVDVVVEGVGRGSSIAGRGLDGDLEVGGSLVEGYVAGIGAPADPAIIVGVKTRLHLHVGRQVELDKGP